MLVLTRAAYDAVVAHAREGAPEEICGVLGGARGAGAGDDPDRATTVHRTANAAAAPRTAYAIDPEEQLTVLETIEDGDLDVVGFYHSHPAGPPRMSATDRERATWDGYAYLLVSLDGDVPFVGAWRWTGERFAPEVLRLAQDSATTPT
ncbi:MAG: desampylase [Haloarculaceae archaeon]